MDQIVITFVPEKETKNTVRYQEQDQTEPGQPAIGTLYVQKATITALGLTPSDNLTVTLGKSK